MGSGSRRAHCCHPRRTYWRRHRAHASTSPRASRRVVRMVCRKASRKRPRKWGRFATRFMRRFERPLGMTSGNATIPMTSGAKTKNSEKTCALFWRTLGRRRIPGDEGADAQRRSAGRFLDWLYDDLSAALSRLIRIAQGDYGDDKYAERFPKFEGPDSGETPLQLFDKWVAEKQPARSTVESWSYVFKAMAEAF